MKAQNYLAALAVAASTLLLVSCKKHDDPVPVQNQFPKTLSNTLFVVTNVKIFSRNGEVVDPVLRNAAMETTGLNTLTRPSQSAGNPNYVVRFNSENSFTLETASSTWFSVSKRDSLFVFTAFNDSSTLSTTSLQANYLFYGANQYYKYLLFTNRPNDITIEKKQFSGYGSYKAIALRGLDFNIIQRDSVTKAFIKRYGTSTLNEFDETSYRFLGKYDTIAVRTYEVRYEQK